MHEDEIHLNEMHNPALLWHGWGSPVGLGLFVFLVSASAALLRFTVRS